MGTRRSAVQRPLNKAPFVLNKPRSQLNQGVSRGVAPGHRPGVGRCKRGRFWDAGRRGIHRAINGILRFTVAGANGGGEDIPSGAGGNGAVVGGGLGGLGYGGGGGIFVFGVSLQFAAGGGGGAGFSQWPGHPGTGSGGHPGGSATYGGGGGGGVANGIPGITDQTPAQAGSFAVGGAGTSSSAGVGPNGGYGGGAAVALPGALVAASKVIWRAAAVIRT
jgi:hypothetical protein